MWTACTIGCTSRMHAQDVDVDLDVGCTSRMHAQDVHLHLGCIHRGFTDDPSQLHMPLSCSKNM